MSEVDALNYLISGEVLSVRSVTSKTRLSRRVSWMAVAKCFIKMSLKPSTTLLVAWEENSAFSTLAFLYDDIKVLGSGLRVGSTNTIFFGRVSDYSDTLRKLKAQGVCGNQPVATCPYRYAPFYGTPFRAIDLLSPCPPGRFE